MQHNTISILSAMAKLVPAAVLVLLYVFVAGRLLGYVTTEFIKQMGG